MDNIPEMLKFAGHIPVILPFREAEIRRIKVQSQPGQIVLKDPI
jgi:hypothetical protein